MSDLIERTDRLRSIVAEARELGSHGSEMQEDILAVCDEIERLQARVEALEEKIADPSWRDFMEISDNFLVHYPPDIFTGVSGDPGPLFVVALREARAALAAPDIREDSDD